MFKTMLDNLGGTTPLVHCITNYVTVNDVANAVLACGGSPIMADDSAEVAEITAICSATVINIGTLNSRTIESMGIAAVKAAELGHPTILDPVGAGASTLRRTTTEDLLAMVPWSVIRGNMSEIMTVASCLGIGQTSDSSTSRGVDASDADTVTDDVLDLAVAFAKRISASSGAVIAITGAVDIIADADRAFIIRNGHPMMAKVTGTGCMLTAVIGAYCGANPHNALEATATAVAVMGVCGERAYRRVANENGGTATFRTYLIDELSKVDAARLKECANIESK